MNGDTTYALNDLLATVMAEQAIAAHDLIVVPERLGVAA